MSCKYHSGRKNLKQCKECIEYRVFPRAKSPFV